MLLRSLLHVYTLPVIINDSEFENGKHLILIKSNMYFTDSVKVFSGMTFAVQRAISKNQSDKSLSINRMFEFMVQLINKIPMEFVIRVSNHCKKQVNVHLTLLIL